MSSSSCKSKGKDNDSHPPCSPETSNHNQDDECLKLNDATTIAMLFSDCDRTSCGHVRVSCLNDYMSEKIGDDPTWQAHNREMLQKLVQLLDPNQLDVEVTREQFISALKTILKISDTDESQEYPIVEPDVFDVVHILDTSTGVLDRSSYSCGGTDTQGLSFNEEDDSEEKIQELHLKVRNLEITVANLTMQVELGEEYNTALHADNDRLLAALHRLDSPPSPLAA
uniref:Uncharacterized protein n=1 Tax=Timema poppense TaxID=170557 RepID=A0A7R9H7S8_TIMPO|nr:unnamed protein product [Timema poppensis]